MEATVNSEQGEQVAASFADVPTLSCAEPRGILYDSLVFHLRNAHLQVLREFDTQVGGHRIRSGGFGILLIIGANPGMSQNQIAAALALDKGAVVDLLNELQQEGLIVRKRSAADRRRHGVFLTPKGVMMLGELKERDRKFEASLRLAFSDEEYEQLLRMLKRLSSTSA